jgi:deoxyribose-phosphate aldolase
VKAAKRGLGRSRMRLGTMVGSPSGTQILAVKAFEASKALEQGANQIDFVLNAGALLSGEDETVYNDMLAVVDMAHSALAVAGVIVEAEPMSDDLVSRACRIAERAGVDYVITSAGESPARRAVRRAALLRDSVGPRVQVKAAGRFRTLADVRAAVTAGATRVSAELSPELAAAATALFGAEPEPVLQPVEHTASRPRAVVSRAG